MDENEKMGILLNNQTIGYSYCPCPPKKKKKKKKSKNSDYNFLSQVDFIQSYMDVDRIKRLRCGESYYPPHEMDLSFRTKKPGFVFGLNLQRNLTGKPQDADGHIVVFGGSGTGKTTCIVKPNFHTWKGRIFALDFKGELVEEAKWRNAMILNLCEDTPNQFYIDPFYSLRAGGENNLIANSRALSFAIIPLPPNIDDPFWIQAAREILTGCLVYYFRLGASFIEAMIDIKCHRLAELITKITSDDLARICLNPDLLYNEKTVAGISMELHNSIAVFATDLSVHNFLSSSNENEKYMVKWTDLEKCDILIRVDQNRLEQWNPVIRLMVTQLISTLEKRPEKYSQEGLNLNSILLMLDEFPQLGKMEIIPSALKIIRSKGVTIAIFCQSLADLDETYGVVTRRTILDNCAYKAIFSAYDPDTQRYFSDLVGTFSIPKSGCSANFDSDGTPTGYGINILDTKERIIQPHEFSSLPEIILLHPYYGGFCRLQKITQFQKKIEEEN